jgi:hypothetical protein
MDFWSVIEFGGEPRKKGALGTENDKRVAGRLQAPAAGERPVLASRVAHPSSSTSRATPEQDGPAPVLPPRPPRAEPPATQRPQAEPRPVEPPPVGTSSDESPAADPAVPDEDWDTAARIAASLRPSIDSMWIDLLSGHTGGDPAMARKVYYVMGGLHLIGELWQDPGVMEVHVRGTRVTVVGELGVREVAGFPSEEAARRAVESAEAAQDRMDARVTRAGESVVVSRRAKRGPTIARLLDSGVVTGDLLSQVETALSHLETVTVTGPAARVVIQAFAALVPPGSRVFEGPHAVLPPGCVTAAEPLDADYVIGVRPGATAERMASAGQVGALIANPESEIRAAVSLVVTGRSASLGMVMRALSG